MSDRSLLERRYRRLLACYPRAFRREHEAEMLVVLLACARDGRRRPGLADSADLLWNALRLRLRLTASRSVPSVFWGVRLMVLAAVFELVSMGTVIATERGVRAAVVRHFPRLDAAHVTAAVHGQVVSVEIGAPIAAAMWLLLAWANDRGHRWARAGAVALFVLTSISLLGAAGQHAAAYALADLLTGVGLCVVALAAMLLIIATGVRPQPGIARSVGCDQCRSASRRGDDRAPGSEPCLPSKTCRSGCVK